MKTFVVALILLSSLISVSLGDSCGQGAPKNCSSCSPDEPTQCDKCDDNFTLDQSTNKCNDSSQVKKIFLKLVPFLPFAIILILLILFILIVVCCTRARKKNISTQGTLTNSVVNETFFERKSMPDVVSNR